MKHHAGYAFVLLAVAAVFGQNDKSAAVELSQEPHYQEILKNSAVRVWLLELPPHQTTAMHRHRTEYIQIQLNDGQTSATRLTSPPSAPLTRQFSEGEMWYAPTTIHSLKSESAVTTVRQIEIELLQRGPSADYVRDAFNDAAQPKFFPPPVDPLATYQQTGTMYNIYLTRQQLLPGAATPLHEHHAAHLVVALSDLELRNEVEGKAPVTVKLSQGEVRWLEGGFKHKLTNGGNRPAQMMTVEYR